jgi:hypothetical protein
VVRQRALPGGRWRAQAPADGGEQDRRTMPRLRRRRLGSCGVAHPLPAATARVHNDPDRDYELGNGCTRREFA